MSQTKAETKHVSAASVSEYEYYEEEEEVEDSVLQS
jgi:hypothetical protein